jgi:cell division protein FtsL
MLTVRMTALHCTDCIVTYSVTMVDYSVNMYQWYKECVAKTEKLRADDLENSELEIQLRELSSSLQQNANASAEII